MQITNILLLESPPLMSDSPSAMLGLPLIIEFSLQDPGNPQKTLAVSSSDALTVANPVLLPLHSSWVSADLDPMVVASLLPLSTIDINSLDSPEFDSCLQADDTVFSSILHIYPCGLDMTITAQSDMLSEVELIAKLILPKYHDFFDVFSKEEAHALTLHRPYDHTIDLKTTLGTMSPN